MTDEPFTIDDWQSFYLTFLTRTEPQAWVVAEGQSGKEILLRSVG